MKIDIYIPVAVGCLECGEDHSVGPLFTSEHEALVWLDVDSAQVVEPDSVTEQGAWARGSFIVHVEIDVSHQRQSSEPSLNDAITYPPAVCEPVNPHYDFPPEWL